MKSLTLNRNSAQLALLQRIELADDNLRKIRKIFIGICFQKFSQYFVNIKNFRKLPRIMNEELDTIKIHCDKKNFLSIGAGIGQSF